MCYNDSGIVLSLITGMKISLTKGLLVKTFRVSSCLTENSFLKLNRYENC